MLRDFSTFIIDRSARNREQWTRILAGTRYRVWISACHLRQIQEMPSGGEFIMLVGLGRNPAEDFAEISRFKRERKGARIIILSERWTEKDLTHAIQAGADGCLSTNLVAQTMIKSLDLIMTGLMVVPRDGLRAVLDAGDASAGMAARVSSEGLHASGIELGPVQRLSGKEQLILNHLTYGASNKAIARELNMAEATVKVHIKGILRKIRVSNRTQAAVWALNRSAYVSLDRVS